MTTCRLFQGKGFNSIHKDIFFSFQVQLTRNISNTEKFHIVVEQAEMCLDVFFFPPTNTVFVLVRMYIGYTKTYFVSISLLLP